MEDTSAGLRRAPWGAELRVGFRPMARFWVEDVEGGSEGRGGLSGTCRFPML